jgi:hypothetical protein
LNQLLRSGAEDHLGGITEMVASLDDHAITIENQRRLGACCRRLKTEYMAWKRACSPAFNIGPYRLSSSILLAGWLELRSCNA